MNNTLIDKIESMDFLSEEKLEQASFFELALYLQHLNSVETLYKDLKKKEESVVEGGAENE